MKDWPSANKLYLLLQKPFSISRSLYQLSFLSPNYFFQLLVMRIWYLHETVSPSWPFSFFLSMYWYCMEKFYSDHSLVLSQAWYMEKIPSPYEESISHSKALPLNLRLYGEQGPLRLTHPAYFWDQQCRYRHVLSVELVRGCGIRRSEVRYLMGTQNTFFVSRSWRDEKT